MRFAQRRYKELLIRRLPRHQSGDIASIRNPVFALAVAASAVGCGLAYFGLKAVITLIPAGTLPAETVLRINAPVLLLTLGITFLSTILCGLAPALHVVRGDVQPHLASSGQGTGVGFRQGKLRAFLVVAEVALAIVLLKIGRAHV